MGLFLIYGFLYLVILEENMVHSESFLILIELSQPGFNPFEILNL